MKHLVTVTLLVETDNEFVDVAEVDTDFMDSLNGQLDGLDDSFLTWVPNDEYDEMAMTEEPTEEEEADGYYQADGNETEEETEETIGWTIVDSQVEKIESIPLSAGKASVSGYRQAIDAMTASVTPSSR